MFLFLLRRDLTIRRGFKIHESNLPGEATYQIKPSGIPKYFREELSLCEVGSQYRSYQMLIGIDEVVKSGNKFLKLWICWDRLIPS